MHAPAKPLIGQRIHRKEDRRFITGEGRYVDDIALPGMAHAAVLRSPHAHARITSIETGQASAMPGVLAIFTGADLAAAGIGNLPVGWIVPHTKGGPMAQPPHPVLATERVRHVGDPVAFVVAESRAEAVSAARMIAIDYERLPPVADLATALDPETHQIWTEAPGNLCYDWEVGDAAATERAFATAAHVTTVKLINNRVHASPMETRGTIGHYDPSSDRYTLYTSNQNPHVIRVLLSIATLKISEEKIRVVAPDVGGGFGMKIYHYAEEVLSVFAAHRLKRPVKWIADRSEAFICDTHARDHVTTVSLALDADGIVQGLKVDTIANMGAYLSTFAPAIPSFFYAYPMPGPYKVRAVHVRTRAAFTTTMPVDAYRGAGRPECTYVLERAMDAAAREMKIDRVEIRRRNLIPAEAFPYKTPLLWTYDVGEFHKLLDRAAEVGAFAGIAERKREALARGRYRGLGFAFYMEACGMGPSKLLAREGCLGGQFEVGQVRVNPTGSVTVLTGSHTHGQGHETVYAQIVADTLGVDFEAIEIVHGDTDRVAYGIGTYGSRSLAVGGSAMKLSLDKVVEKGRKIAAHLLEADDRDIEFKHGHYRIAGTDRSKSFKEIAAAAYNPADYPLDKLEPGLEETTWFDPPDFTFPYGCHICEIEVDPETGKIDIVALAAVDDFGNQVNPMIVEGQIHGGLAQGSGQALLEHCAFDPETGQLLSGSFMDYAMPRADDLPSMRIESLVTACRNNPLGVKGCGEAGAIAGPAALVSAVLDALSPLGVTSIDMPVTAEKVWRACQDAQKS
ncbi:xanthine dehydrogenase family protein molybdopterin-binding subunit [Aestuariivirga sp. YIM B02566]|uniref:Xanthine dehydrogenase family protein molybdopterin-binding subunit n=1 Tax=Taklimakanibacter albus TaxID=2800327 RepID=A0ACC5R6S9_9HYPH|nr:xanthine dehydrogenase family protein molybdopterin-binding subunit [Aestuariivirga sp. YIM B02566]MBK1868376.1 xanthine dehydrogenase family protein molybdopterin-binding subunit [Aestuariivirga sp. YIM B02566]